MGVPREYGCVQAFATSSGGKRIQRCENNRDLSSVGGLNFLDDGIPVSTSYDFFLTNGREILIGTSGKSFTFRDRCCPWK